MQLENNPVYFDNEFVKSIAEDINVGTVTDQVCEVVLQHVCNAAKQAVSYAKENATACARTEIGMEDVRIALKDLGVSVSFLSINIVI